jgi:hypothetical protein
MEVRVREVHQFYTYAQWLTSSGTSCSKSPRALKWTSRNSREDVPPRALRPLEYPARIPRPLRGAERELDEYFLRPFTRFLNKLNEELGSDFVEWAREISSRASDVTIKVTNVLDLSVLDAEV